MAVTTPRDSGFRMPGEWEPHAATWVAWPSHPALWLANLGPARAAFAELVEALAAGEDVHVLALDDAQEGLAREWLEGEGVHFHVVPFGDIWLRDTAPLFMLGPEGALAAATFRFNGWGGKYVLPHDDGVSAQVAEIAGVRRFSGPFVLEGGAVDSDGQGTVLTTRQCMLNPNRNGPTDEATVTAQLEQWLGARKVLWLGDGLMNDHTDGHVDTLVRFVRPGAVVAMEPRAGDDPNADVLRRILDDAAAWTDADGRSIEIIRIPSPGRIVDPDGRVMPASYANFYIANSCVVVPTYGSPFDDEAVERIGAIFPDRPAVGIDARAILSGGGAFHCITQQQPAVEAP